MAIRARAPWPAIRMTLLALCATVITPRTGRPESTTADAPPVDSVLTAPFSAYFENWPGAQDCVFVRSLRIEPSDIFTREEVSTRPVYARLANALHIVTRPDVIRRGLYVREGGSLCRDDLAASVRRLRSYRFLHSAIGVDVTGGPDSVDITVRTRDAWSTEPMATARKHGSLLSWSAGVRESNLLGFGKELLFEVGEDEERSFWGVAYVDRQLFNTPLELSCEQAHGADLERTELTLARPFDRPATRWGCESQLFRYRGTVIDRRGGLDGPEYAGDDWFILIAGGRRLCGSTREALRLVPSLYWKRERFRPMDAPLVDPTSGCTLPDLRDREIFSPGVQLHAWRERFSPRRVVNGLGLWEDIDLGTRIRLHAGYSARRWGADRDAAFFLMDTQQGLALGREPFLTARLYGQGLVDRGTLRDALLSATVRGYHPLSKRQTLAVRLSGDRAVRLSPQDLPTLGAERGLRGFEAYRFWGERVVLTSVEDRLLVARDIGGLVSIGVVGFVDAGSAWRSGEHRDARWRMATGAGVRLQGSRTHAALVARIDAGYPLVGRTPGDGWVLSVAAGQAF